MGSRSSNMTHVTLVRYVENLKFSHVDSFEINKLAGYLPSILTVQRGKVHDYLGMDLDYTKQGTMKVFMIKYLYNVLKEFPNNLSTIAATPASDHIFTVQYEDKI